MASDRVLTFGAQPVPLASVFPGACRRVEVEPLRSNSNPAWVGTSAMNGDGATGVIQELAAPAAGVPLDRFVDHAAGDAHNVDVTPYCVHGAAGEGCRATFWTI